MNTDPETQWLEAWRHIIELRMVDPQAGQAILGLYELIEPPSVRERRHRIEQMVREPK